MIEFRDAWAEGDGERVLRCWRLFLPHFRVAGHTKYSLAAFNVQLQIKATLSQMLHTKSCGTGLSIPGEGLAKTSHVTCIMSM